MKDEERYLDTALQAECVVDNQALRQQRAVTRDPGTPDDTPQFAECSVAELLAQMPSELSPAEVAELEQLHLEVVPNE